MADTTARNFSMSYGELIGICSGVYGFMQRDASEFLLYGVSATTISDFNDVLQDFIDLPQDQELEALEINKTFVKNERANELRIMLRPFATRAKLVFGDNDGIYNMFHKKDLSRLNDQDLYLFAKVVHDSSEEYLTELTPVGMTQDMIDDLGALILSFYNAMFAQGQAIANRDNAAKERVEKANELYALLTRYCEIGKSIWYETNEAKYNDYIIYSGTSPGSLTAPQNFMFDPINYDFSWSAVENATSYILQSSTDGTNWTEYWAGHETTCAYEESPTTIMYFRVLAHNSSGNGPASNTLQYDFAPVLIAPGNFAYDPDTYYFTWNDVPNMQYYEFQYRPVTNPNWYSLNAGVATSFLHADPPGNHLARVRAVSGTTFGPWSVELNYSPNSGGN